jgi:uncharacterized protein (TIGR02246 family)
VTGHRSEEITLKFVERINARDADGLAELATEDFTFIDHDGDVYSGREEMRKGFDDYFTAYPEYVIHVAKVLRSGDAVAIVGQTTGSHIAPEIEAVETVLWIARLRGGLVAEWRIYAEHDLIQSGG